MSANKEISKDKSLSHLDSPELVALLSVGQYTCRAASSLTKPELLKVALQNFDQKEVLTKKEFRDSILSVRQRSPSTMTYMMQSLERYGLITSSGRTVSLSNAGKALIENISHTIQRTKSKNTDEAIELLAKALQGIKSFPRAIILYSLSIGSRYFGELLDVSEALIRTSGLQSTLETNDFTYHLTELKEQGYVVSGEDRKYSLTKLGALSSSIFENTNALQVKRHPNFITQLNKELAEVAKPQETKALQIDLRSEPSTEKQNSYEELIAVCDASPYKTIFFVDETRKFIGLLPSRACAKLLVTAMFDNEEFYAKLKDSIVRVNAISRSDKLAQAFVYLMMHDSEVIPIEDNGKFCGIVESSDVLKALTINNEKL